MCILALSTAPGGPNGRQSLSVLPGRRRRGSGSGSSLPLSLRRHGATLPLLGLLPACLLLLALPLPRHLQVQRQRPQLPLLLVMSGRPLPLCLLPKLPLNNLSRLLMDLSVALMLSALTVAALM